MALLLQVNQHMGLSITAHLMAMEQENKAEISSDFLFKGTHPVPQGIPQPHLVNFLPPAKNMKLRSSL